MLCRVPVEPHQNKTTCQFSPYIWAKGGPLFSFYCTWGESKVHLPPFSLVCIFSISLGRNFEDDLEFLLEGIPEFDLMNGVVASEVLVHGPLAFPIGTTAEGRAFLAGAYYGQGRVVIITHEGLLRREVGLSHDVVG